MNEFFFCMNCHVIAELDKHGRCGTCGSDAVTYPGIYQLWMPQLEADCMSEKSPARLLSSRHNDELDRDLQSIPLAAGMSQ